MSYKYLWTPLQLGPVTTRNRIVFSAHLTNYARNGKPTEQHSAYYAARAAGGAGLIIFFDVESESSRLARVRYVTDGGPVVYELKDYREISEGLVVPFRVEVERGDGRRELISVKVVETAGRPPSGAFDKPGS